MMAHPPEVKAQALALLLTGERVMVVSRKVGIPKQTISRWRRDSDSILRQAMRGCPELRAAVASVRSIFVNLSQVDRDIKKSRCAGDEPAL